MDDNYDGLLVSSLLSSYYNCHQYGVVQFFRHQRILNYSVHMNGFVF
jgi:hypothetical protein